MSSLFWEFLFRYYEESQRLHTWPANQPPGVIRYHIPAKTDSSVALKVWQPHLLSLVAQEHFSLPRQRSLIARIQTAQDIQRNALEFAYYLQCPTYVPAMSRRQVSADWLRPQWFLVGQVWERMVTFKEVLQQNYPKLQNSFEWIKRWARCQTQAGTFLHYSQTFCKWSLLLQQK